MVFPLQLLPHLPYFPIHPMCTHPFSISLGYEQASAAA